MKRWSLAMIAAPVLLGTITMPLAQTGQPFALSLPLACSFGETCFIQQYFDHDPGPGAKDYACGPMSYDGHDGVDLRVPSLSEQQRGVDVLAAAPGIVRGLRDGMEDASVRLMGRESVAGRECGNGVVLLHAGGWETQYCHMAKGSVRARVGERVGAGAVLGRVGMSGETEFPHLHFSVRRNGETVDPFALDARPEACGEGRTLWTAEAAAALAYRSPAVINAGFAPGPVTMDDVEFGRAASRSPDAESPAIVVFVRAIGLRAGDVQAMELRGPGGILLARSENPPLDGHKAQWLMFVGKRRTEREWPRGAYEAQYEVKRGGATALVKRFDFLLR